MIKFFAASILIYTLLLAAGTYFLYGLALSVSVFLGGFTMWVNVVGLAYYWSRIFQKKSIALTGMAIIFKYLILALILWSLSSSKWLNPAAFCVGLTALLFGVLVVLLKSHFSTKA